MRILFLFLITLFWAPSLFAEIPTKTLSTQLALNWKPEPQFGGFYAAALNGHFQKAGLRVEILEGGAGTPVVQMIAAGRMDFGVASADEIVISRSRGSDVVALFATYQTNPQAIMVREDVQVASLKDLYQRSDMTLALQKGLPYALYLQKKFNSAKIKVVPYSGGIAQFLVDSRYAQQCFFTAEPLAAQKQGLKVKTFLVADEGYNPYTTVLITRESVLKTKPELVKAMIQAVRLGWTDYLANPSKVNDHMAQMNRAMDLATFAASAQAQKQLIETSESKKLGLGAMTEARWLELSKQLADLKIITKQVDPKSLYR